MAIHNPNTLYSGGVVELNQNPHTALYAQLSARKAARDEAFDDYIRNLNKGINAAGMRNQDRPVFDQKLSDFQNFYMKNRDAIKNRRGGADIAYQQQYQDLLNLISESKTEEEKKKPAIELMLDPNKRDRLNNDEFIDMMHSHDQPLYVQKPDGSVERNQNRKTFDPSRIAFDPKPFEQDKYFKQFEDLKRSDLPPTVVTDPKTMTQTVTTNSVFDKDAKDAIATRAVTDLMQNKSFKEVISKLDPKEYNDLFKQNYGHDIQNEGDLAAAYTLKGLQQKVSTSKINPDTFERQKAMAAINNQYALGRLKKQDDYIKGRIAYRKAQGKQEQDGILEGYINRAFDEGTDSKGAIYIKGKPVVGRQIAVPREITDKYTIDKGKDWAKPPIKFIMTEDKKYVIPVYGGESTKNTRNEIPVENFRNDLGKIWLTKKDLAAEMGDELDFGEDEDNNEPPISIPASTPPKKQTTAKDPLGLF